MRIFTAIEIPPDIRDEIFRAASPLGAAGGISVIRRDNLHITIKFISETDEDGLKRIKLAAGNVANRRAKTLKISGFGCFPTDGPPRIVWAGITQGDDFIAAAARQLDMALSQKAHVTSGAFVPHITVARIRNGPGGQREQIERFIAEAVLSTREFKPEAISVIKSTLSPSGAIYETIFTAKFAGPENPLIPPCTL
ncbi:MAG: RNA 2',3'-cyclic phosphodiesterase [Elusimicrobia bacterium HGW-Elusimicrobia-1]|jgi:2'-5' RNA ligase|nr:MAG: RNA 2',3'-cyclic phosphodiesterase [Elusimicrobia bacterium HGW-Elusimicrobia-1]